MPHSCGEASVHMESGSAPVAIGGTKGLVGRGRERTASGEEAETPGRLAACVRDLEYRLLATMKVIPPGLHQRMGAWHDLGGGGGEGRAWAN